MLERLARSRYAFPAAILAVAAIAGIVVLIVQSGGDGGGSEEEATCTQVSASSPKEVSGLKAPKGRLDAATTYTAAVKTNCGTFAFDTAWIIFEPCLIMPASSDARPTM